MRAITDSSRTSQNIWRKQQLETEKCWFLSAPSVVLLFVSLARLESCCPARGFNQHLSSDFKKPLRPWSAKPEHTHSLSLSHTHTHTHTHTLSLTHTHTHTLTHTHKERVWSAILVGTLHRRNGFYTVQTVFSIALHLNLPLTGNCAFLLSQKNSFCMIYKLVSSWGPKKCPQNVKIHWYYYPCYGPHNVMNARFTHTHTLHISFWHISVYGKRYTVHC